MSKKKDVTVTPNGDAVYTPGLDSPAPEHSAQNSNGKAPPLTPRERFVKYAERRVAVALKKLAHVKNMGNKASYQYTEEEAAKIITALEEGVAAIRRAFTGTTEKRVAFQLF